MAYIRCGDASLAAQVLTETLEDENHVEFLAALGKMARTFGGTPIVAEQAELNLGQIDSFYSENENPALRNVLANLKALGMKLRGMAAK